MPATDRLLHELCFHDKQAARRRVFFQENPAALFVNDDAYLDHETWLRHAFSELGDVRGKRVLDYGCGHGMASVVLARRGAHVTAFDLSAGYVAEAQQRASANAVGGTVALLQASAEQLPLANELFDAVWGHAVLHHLDVGRAAAEVARVLRPTGVAVFCEPWGENPLLEWARRRMPGARQHHTPNERPLRRRDLALLRQHFRTVNRRPFQLLSMVRRAWQEAPFQQALGRYDAALLDRWPSLGRFCRYMVLSLRR